MPCPPKSTRDPISQIVVFEKGFNLFFGSDTRLALSKPGLGKSKSKVVAWPGRLRVVIGYVNSLCHTALLLVGNKSVWCDRRYSTSAFSFGNTFQRNFQPVRTPIGPVLGIIAIVTTGTPRNSFSNFEAFFIARRLFAIYLPYRQGFF